MALSAPANQEEQPDDQARVQPQPEDVRDRRPGLQVQDPAQDRLGQGPEYVQQLPGSKPPPRRLCSRLIPDDSDHDRPGRNQPDQLGVDRLSPGVVGNQEVPSHCRESQRQISAPGPIAHAPPIGRTHHRLRIDSPRSRGPSAYDAWL